MAHGEETEAEEREVGVGEQIVPTVRQPVHEERPAGGQQRQVVGALRGRLSSLAERVGHRRRR